jgi:hypothetical protein
MGTCPGKEDDPNPGILTGITEGIVHLKDGFGTESIAFVGAVDGDFGNTVCFVVENVFVGFGSLPVNLHNKVVCIAILIKIRADLTVELG